MVFDEEGCDWESLAKAEVLGPFASRSAWLWAKEQNDWRLRAHGSTTGLPSFSAIKTLMAKALVSRMAGPQRKLKSVMRRTSMRVDLRLRHRPGILIPTPKAPRPYDQGAVTAFRKRMQQVLEATVYSGLRPSRSI
jgi:hypothetical protein